MKDSKACQQDNNAPASPLRRKTIKTLAYGVGALAGTTVLPDKWVTPVIQGIALPAHAQTSAALAFCSGRHELTLVDGHTGTDEMTIEANGCITPAQAGVELELTLEGYDTPAITQNEHPDGHGPGSLLAAVTDAIVPSAHAAPAPKCTVKVKVKTDAKGNYKASFKLSCGKGIVQVVMHGTLNGQQKTNLGWLDIGVPGPTSIEACDQTGPNWITSSPLEWSLDGGVTWGVSVKTSTAHLGNNIMLRNTSGAAVICDWTLTYCDGTQITNTRAVAAGTKSYEKLNEDPHFSWATMEYVPRATVQPVATSKAEGHATSF